MFAAGVCALSACSSADEQLPDGASSAQSVYHFQATIDSDSRTTFSEDCSRLVWTAGDRLSLFTEAGDEFVLSNRYEEESDFRAPLSSGATEVYAFYPADFAYQNCALRVTTETRCYYFPTGMDIDFRDVYTIHPFVLNLANGQEEIIYDEEAFAPEFLQYLLETIDADQDGKISNVEVSNVEELSLADQGLTSLKGIEYFTNLKKLNCEQNQLTTLDVSACSNLRQLDCSNNQLQELNVAGCSQLATIYCNYNQLQTLDVSTCLDLYTFHCTGNQLKQLDLTRNTNLSWISCASNQIEKLELGGCSPSGISITCDENKLTKLDISMCEGDCIFIFAYSMNIPEDETFTFIKKKGQEVAILNLPKGSVTEEVDE